MRQYQREFVELCLELEVLRFGEFTLKSGRHSPYFFNAGRFCTGASLQRLGQYYARAISDAGIRFDMLFGPAYKGIPLVASVAIAFAELNDRDVPYAFNRKEVKDHGEGGVIVGAPLAGRVLVIDDVISAGTSARESAGLIESAGATLCGLAIALDRQERGEGERSAVQEVEEALGIPVASIIGLEHLVAYLEATPGHESWRAAMRTYREAYGVGSSALEGEANARAEQRRTTKT